MPELPEVETVARALEKVVKNKKIGSATLVRQRLAPDHTPAQFSKKLKDATINFIHRRGKHILFDLDNGRTLITHLRMSGRFVLLNGDPTDPKFAHAIFYFDDDTRLVFDDQRHFGLMKIVDTAQLNEAKEISKLAPEPFSEDFSIDYLRAAMRSSNRPIKEFLLDQTKVCGLGNIYAAEALFLSGISPRRRGRSVSGSRAELLHRYIRTVLQEAIDAGGSINSDPTFLGEEVYGGASENAWRVYDREGEACPTCSYAIRRIRQGARSTYYCPKCQR
jgi:formamidopyrimidine-DNA glycosylase